MEMHEKYRLYGLHYPQAIFAAVLTIVGYGVLKLMERDPAALPDNIVRCGWIWLILMIGAGLSAQVRNSFHANEERVTFSQLFMPSTTIYYRDIQNIVVTNKYKHVYRRRRGGDSFYVETIRIITFDKEYVFHTRMDIKPNRLMEASGMMDKMLEMGKFAVLKRFIEAKIMY